MPFANIKEFKKLMDRVAAIEDELGINEVPTIDQELSLYDVYGEELAQLLAEHYKTPEQVEAAPDEELLDISGVGPATLKKIRETE
jgi:excinuclease UvrABC nuclease subunit